MLFGSALDKYKLTLPKQKTTPVKSWTGAESGWTQQIAKARTSQPVIPQPVIPQQKNYFLARDEGMRPMGQRRQLAAAAKRRLGEV